jgi:signal transduction histidine kinase
VCRTGTFPQGSVRVKFDWMTSPTAHRILSHFADSRPAWLWSQDGSTLLWRNESARYFNAKLKKSGPRLSAEAVPIRGQVARLIRLGSLNRTSLARVQFLAGEKPVAATCSCTPLEMPDGDLALLLIGMDPIDAEIRAALGELGNDSTSAALLPEGAAFRLLAPGATVPEDPEWLAIPASPAGHILLVRAETDADRASIESVRGDEGLDAEDDARDLADLPEPMLPMGLEPAPAENAGEIVAVSHDPDEWHPVAPSEEVPESGLTSLFDRLANDADLYSPLTEADETFAGVPPEHQAAPEAPAEADEDLIASVIEYAEDREEEAPETAAPGPQSPPRSHWLITGRGFRLAEAPTSTPEAPSPTEELEHEHVSTAEQTARPAEPAPTPALIIDPNATGDAETAERVSRYNFEELGRILTDRVSAETAPPAESAPPVSAPTGIISLNAETLVLNRLPLALLVFRDQQVLFANRAFTDLLGYDTVDALRRAGISAIFPAEGDASAGPVNRLTRRDGQTLNVTARLQSVSWQGRAALMLSANQQDVVRNHEAAVRAFAELSATARKEGFVSADRAGIILHLSGAASNLLGEPGEFVGRPLTALIAPSRHAELRDFLEKPARFAETARPHLALPNVNGDAEITLFAQGQAGVIEGYFGFVRAVRAAGAIESDESVEPELLGRLSRGIRRPLNTIIGFADLMREASLAGQSERAAEYARDIKTAGVEIAVLADELDDFTRLRDGRYTQHPTDIDLGGLLEGCISRVRQQAGAARVLVRSAISERLPRIRADRSSLAQALLNLLASAIDQTPVGGSVILSAQRHEDGGIAIHVRDGATSHGDISERFVVFRDGVDRDGDQLTPVRSSVGLALTRSLLAVNECSLSVDPTMNAGTLFSLLIPADAIVRGDVEPSR